MPQKIFRRGKPSIFTPGSGAAAACVNIQADRGYAGALAGWFQGQAGTRDCVLEIMRLLARDYETAIRSSRAMIYRKLIHLKLKRLTNVKPSIPIHAPKLPDRLPLGATDNSGLPAPAASP